MKKRNVNEYVSVLLAIFINISFSVFIQPFLTQVVLADAGTVRIELLLVFCQITINVCVPYIILKLSGKKAVDPVFERILEMKDILTGFFIAIFLFAIIRTMSDGYKWINIGITRDLSIYKSVEGLNLRQIFSLCIFQGLIPGICEEYFFRHFIANILAGKSKKMVLTVMLCSFTLCHINSGIETVIMTLILGFSLSLLFLKYNNYLLVVCVHVFFDSISLFFTYGYFWITDCVYINTRGYSPEICIVWGMVYLSAVFFALGLGILLWRFIKKR